MTNRSTETAALELMDRNITAMNDQLTPITIYLDLSKAFDSIDHNILASKLKYYGIQGMALNLLKKHPEKLSNLNITVNNKIIEQENHFNYLGITLDQNITWTTHRDKVSMKISHVTGLLRKLQHIFPKHILITIYNSLIHSYLIYGLLVWGFRSGRVKIL